jgi:hypothetical protein
MKISLSLSLILLLVLLSGCTEITPVSATISAKTCAGDMFGSCLVSQTLALTVNFENKNNVSEDFKYIIKDADGLVKIYEIETKHLGGDKVLHLNLPGNEEGIKEYETYIKIGESEYESDTFSVDIRKPQIERFDIECEGCKGTFGFLGFKRKSASYTLQTFNQDKNLEEFKIEIAIPTDVRIADTEGLTEINSSLANERKFEKYQTANYGEPIGLHFDLLSDISSESCSHINIVLYVKLLGDDDKKWYTLDMINSRLPGQSKYQFCHNAREIVE